MGLERKNLKVQKCPNPRATIAYFVVLNMFINVRYVLLKTRNCWERKSWKVMGYQMWEGVKFSSF